MGLRGATPNKSTHGEMARFRAASSLISEGVGGDEEFALNFIIFYSRS